MLPTLIIAATLAVSCLSQSGKQCYKFTDLTQNYGLKSDAQGYPRDAIVQEYGMRQELQEFLGNILGQTPTVPSMTRSTSNVRDTVNNGVLMTPKPIISFNPKTIPVPFAGANPNGRINPYLKYVVPFQRPLAPKTSPIMPKRPFDPLIRGPIPTQIPVTPYPAAQARVIPSGPFLPPKVAPTPMYAGHRVQNILLYGPAGAQRNLPLNLPRGIMNPTRRLAPVPRTSKFTIEQLRKMAMPYKRPYQRYVGFNPFARRYQYGRQSGHFIRKRAAARRITPKYTYKQLLQLATPVNRYRGATGYNNQIYGLQPRVGYYRSGVNRGPYYPSYNGYNPYRNNFNPYTARRYTNLRTRIPIVTRFHTVNQYPVRSQYPQTSRGYRYAPPQYRHKRSVRINPSEEDEVKPVSETCPATMMSIEQFTGLGGNCWVLEPEKQMVDYAMCGHDDCYNCKTDEKDEGNVSRCVENYHWVPVWAYCQGAPQGKKIQEVELYLPKSCSCKTYQC